MMIILAERFKNAIVFTYKLPFLLFVKRLLQTMGQRI